MTLIQYIVFTLIVFNLELPTMQNKKIVYKRLVEYPVFYLWNIGLFMVGLILNAVFIEYSFLPYSVIEVMFSGVVFTYAVFIGLFYCYRPFYKKHLQKQLLKGSVEG